MIQGIIPYAHHLLETTINPGDIVVDATCGNGHDTVKLASIVGDTGHVYAFDIQAEAIENTIDRMQSQGSKQATYIQDSHAKVDEYILEEHKGKLGGAIFNLGYLPNSDKEVITSSTSTIPAVDQLLEYIQKGRLVIIVVYYGHDGGQAEKAAVLNYVEALEQDEYSVLQYRFINQKNDPPFLVAIQKR